MATVQTAYAIVWADDTQTGYVFDCVDDAVSEADREGRKWKAIVAEKHEVSYHVAMWGERS